LIKIKDIFWRIPKEALYAFSNSEAFTFGGALSFYALFSLVPLLILLLTVTGIFVEAEAVQRELLRRTHTLFGSLSRDTVAVVLEHAERFGEKAWASYFGMAVLIFGATAFFSQLQAALNHIWGVQPAPAAMVRSFLLTRLISSCVVTVVVLLLLLSVMITTALSLISGRFSVGLREDFWIWNTLDVVGSFFLTSVLFAMIFRFLPDVEIAWSDVWIGATVSALLFTLGKELIGFFLVKTIVSSGYGAAASLVAWLSWVYYSSLIILFGAEIAQVYTSRFGTGIRPRRFAVLIDRRD
jgi:membrane protein